MTTTIDLTGSWIGDPVHSDVSFKVRHMAVGKARGSFTLREANLTVGPDGLAGASVTAVIEAASVDTKQEQRDAHVRSADFLDVETHPTIEFDSTGVRELDGDTFTLEGNLRIRGTSRPVELAAEFIGVTNDAYGQDRVGFSASTQISRKEFGVAFNAAFGAGDVVVADKVEIDLELEFTRSPAN